MICGCGGIGRLIGFRCCHLSEGFQGGIAVKWNENAFARKTISVVGYISIAAYLILSALELFDIQSVHKAVAHVLLGVFFLSQGLTVENGKRKIWGYTLAAGWFLLSVMYCF